MHAAVFYCTVATRASPDYVTDGKHSSGLGLQILFQPPPPGRIIEKKRIVNPSTCTQFSKPNITRVIFVVDAELNEECSLEPWVVRVDGTKKTEICIP